MSYLLNEAFRVARRKASSARRRIDHIATRHKKRVRHIQTTEAHAYWRRQPIKKGQVLYESYSGNGMTCSPEAVFLELLESQDLKHFRHVWVLRDLEKYSATVERYRKHRNVRFVKYGSAAYYRALATSQYLVNNVTFPPQFSKRPGQIYLNTWHGVPLKKMGYHVAGRAWDARNIVRNFLAADFLVSTSERMTELMYMDAFKLRNVFDGAVIEEGQPRTDRQFLTEASREDLRRRLEHHGILLDNREVVLYAPTWKGASYFNPTNDSANLVALIDELESKIDTARFRVMVKAHQVVAEAVAQEPRLKGRLVPNEIPTNLMLGATSVLITDYSSIFYDFLPTGRPVLFYIPDLEMYRSYRDVYIEPQSFPGPVALTVEELGNLTVKATDGLSAFGPEVQERYVRAVEEYCPREDGGCAARIIDVVFRGRGANYRVRRSFSDGREKILIYLGGLTSNGITTSALNLLSNIDYDRFDVTAYYPFSRDKEKMRNSLRIDGRARSLARDGTFNGGRAANLERLEGLKRGLTKGGHSPRVEALWRDEWTRCFGNAQFDYIVDFSGYSPFWSFLFLQGGAKRYAIWQHNDLAADSRREVNGGRPLEMGLRAVFSTYAEFDSLVSVSSGLEEINRSNLSPWATPEAFTSAVNTIDHRRILELAHGNATLPSEDNREGDSLQYVDLVRDVAALVERYSLEDVRQEAARLALLDSVLPRVEEVTTTFVTVGRLSPEKNHARLIRAFREVHREYPHTRLVIVGTGPLKKDLQRLIAEMGLHNAVRLAGHQQNPYLLMAHADCFVMSSDYEGQPMVILEALTLGLPVVSTAFGSVRSALPEGSGLVVEQSDVGLARGLLSFLEGGVPRSSFDPEQYNRDAVLQFYAAIGADDALDSRGSKPGIASASGALEAGR